MTWVRSCEETKRIFVFEWCFYQSMSGRKIARFRTGRSGRKHLYRFEAASLTRKPWLENLHDVKFAADFTRTWTWSSRSRISSAVVRFAGRDRNRLFLSILSGRVERLICGHPRPTEQIVRLHLCRKCDGCLTKFKIAALRRRLISTKTKTNAIFGPSFEDFEHLFWSPLFRSSFFSFLSPNPQFSSL